MTEVRDPRRVEARPEKRFFIEMLVKDIELIPAVLDLVDNSVDGARALRAGVDREPDSKLYAGLRVSIDVGPDRFRIVDNCGGIDLEVARNYAFRFGRPAEFEGTPGSVGQFGVGMKRALFKLGRFFRVESRTADTRFALEVDVDTWAAVSGPEWVFEFQDQDASFTPSESEPVGTDITVTRLHQTVSEDFANSNVIGTLRAQLRLRHQSAIEDGMRLTLNGDALAPLVPMLQQSGDIQPINRVFRLEDPVGEGSGTVHVRLYAGVAPGEKEGEREVDEGDAESFRTDADAGWYVFCNDRLLLAADRSALTGWGNGAPAYHPQYRRFRGYVFLESLAPALLPWNTTKTGVDQDSRVWRQTAEQMRVALAGVIAMLNRVKYERQNADVDEERPLTKALEAAAAVPLRQVTQSSVLRFPEPPRIVVRRAAMKNIQYRVDVRHFDQVATALGTTSAAEVGRGTFDFFYRNQVGGDD